MEKNNNTYPVSFEVDYAEKHNRRTSLVRILLAIPILAILAILSGDSDIGHASRNSSDVLLGLSGATALMIIFQEVYPRWWFDFALELNRFSARVAAYVFLLTDEYPSTVSKQSVHLDIDYPDVKKDLNNLMAASEVVFSHTALHLFGGTNFSRVTDHSGCLVRYPPYRPLSAQLVRLCRRRRALDYAG